MLYALGPGCDRLGNLPPSGFLRVRKEKVPDAGHYITGFSAGRCELKNKEAGQKKTQSQERILCRTRIAYPNRE